MLLGGVEELFADVVSRAALDLFAAAGKAVAYTVAVPHIINRADDGICPVERLCAEAQTAQCFSCGLENRGSRPRRASSGASGSGVDPVAAPAENPCAGQ